jgi:hypothetical protein
VTETTSALRRGLRCIRVRFRTCGGGDTAISSGVVAGAMPDLLRDGASLFQGGWTHPTRVRRRAKPSTSAQPSVMSTQCNRLLPSAWFATASDFTADLGG